MKFLAIAFVAVLAVVGASTLSANYLPPVADNSLSVHEYLAPVEEAPTNQTKLADDGYRYKTVRRLKYRQRRDVNELPASQYLPPVTNAEDSLNTEAVEPVADVKTQLADEGYRYKVVRRLKYRQRRDVNELPKNEYLPPTAESGDTTVVEVAEPVAEEQSKLANDGYRYKVVRRLKYRQRRDVNELPKNEYLPPTKEEAADTTVVKVAQSVPEAETQLANDGYRYKVVRRLKYRQRRDVNELPQIEYIAPSDSKDAPQNEYLPPVEEATESALSKSAEPTSEQATQLANDGYRYKVVRRLKYRHRRDVNELPQIQYLAPAASSKNEYLPPIVEAQDNALPKSTATTPEQDTQFSSDGDRYKVVRRLKYRQRRDVHELPQNEYLPPAAEVKETAVASEVAEPDTEDAATALANDGYRYKVVRRLKYRHRRDVNELPANEYLPPATMEGQPSIRQEPEVAAAVLTNNGYQYKIVRRLKYRRQ
ncbi:uncharacterized protein [Eurosta solidaginis]|uniref:uncharacterized protein n=1 Tax=Eurosta solidaginis TaxID=178769 RepID=UPI0035308302